MAASALWMLAEVDATRKRMPVDHFVPALLEFAHRLHSRLHKDRPPPAPPEDGAPLSASLARSEGPGRAYAPRSAASAAWRLAAALPPPASRPLQRRRATARACRHHVRCLPP